MEKWKQRELDFKAYFPRGHYHYNYAQGEGAYLCEEGCVADLIDNENNEADGVFVVQYTGVKDVNGKKIFEGDIVRYISYTEGNERYGTIVYYFDRFVTTDRKHVCSLDMAKEKIIFGNFFQNPELVEKYNLELNENS